MLGPIGTPSQEGQFDLGQSMLAKINLRRSRGHGRVQEARPHKQEDEGGRERPRHVEHLLTLLEVSVKSRVRRG